MTKFKEIFRIESARLNEWDYSNPWWYYVTINTKNHIEFFGKVLKGKMILNELGKKVEEEWLKTKLIRSNVDLDFFIVMPNHIHGIVILNPVETRRGVSQENKMHITMETRRGESLQKEDLTRFGRPIKNSLSVIINQFKGAIKRWTIKNNYTNYSWQPRFYDRIIHNEKELYNIRKYIEQNPLKRELEKDDHENINDGI